MRRKAHFKNNTQFIDLGDRFIWIFWDLFIQLKNWFPRSWGNAFKWVWVKNWAWKYSGIDGVHCSVPFVWRFQSCSGSGTSLLNVCVGSK